MRIRLWESQSLQIKNVETCILVARMRLVLYVQRRVDHAKLPLDFLISFD